MNDGKLDLDEINAAFAAVDTKAKSAADLHVEAKQNGTDIVIKADGGTEVLAAQKPDGQIPDEHDIDEEWDKEEETK